MSDAHSEPGFDTSTAAHGTRELIEEIDAAILGPGGSPDIAIDLTTPERELGEGRELFARLYVTYRPAIAAQVRRFLNDARDVDEVVQETFLKLLLALPDLQTDGQVIAWCRRTATNMCIDRYRAAGRRPSLTTLDSMPAGVEAVFDQDPVVLAEDAAVVREALARLSPMHRQALIMREVEERTLPEIAAALEISESAVKHVLYRARKAMRRALESNATLRAGALALAIVVGITGSWLGLRGSGSGAKPQIAALPEVGGGLDPMPHATPPAAVSKPTHVAAPHRPVVTHLASTMVRTPVTAPVETVSQTSPVVSAPSIANDPFTYEDATQGTDVLAKQGQTASWSDDEDGQEVDNALSDVQVPGVADFLLSLSRAADTSSSASASVSMMIDGHMTQMQVGRAVSSVQPQADGTLIVAIDELLTGKDTAGNQVMAPRRLQVATRYAGDLANLIFSRIEVSSGESA